jgi:hypothetical protein
MNDLKSALIKLLTVYVVIVGSVAVLGTLLALVTGALSEGGGFPFPLVPIITLGSALILLGFFVCIAIGIAVYHDARKRDMEPLLWALVAALVPYFLGLIAYLIARKPAACFCPECGAAVPERSAFCPQCGHAVQNPCPGCSRAVEPGTRFCPHCGTGIGAETAEN